MITTGSMPVGACQIRYERHRISLETSSKVAAFWTVCPYRSIELAVCSRTVYELVVKAQTCDINEDDTLQISLTRAELAACDLIDE